MRHPSVRTWRSLLSVPFAAGILVGVAATGASASVLGSSVFRDVPAGSYYDKAVGELNAAGIIKGSNGKFQPEKPVSRAEVAVMLARLRAELKGEPWDDGTTVQQPQSSSAPVTTESSATSRSRRSSSSRTSSSSSSSSSSVSSSASSYNPKGSFRFTTTNFTVGEQQGKVNVTVVRTGGNEGTAAINYTLTPGTATAGSDYVTASGTIVLSNKETSKSVTLTILDDSTGEGDEIFNVVLSNPQYGVGLAAPATATVTIKDNENGGSNSSTSSASSSSTGPAAGTFNFNASAYAMNEAGGPLSVTVIRTGGSQGTVNVNYATSNGSATSGTDYNAANGTLTFNAGETTKTFSVTALNNASITGNRTFNLVLSGQTGGAALGDAKQATVTVYDDESGDFGSGSLKFSKASYEVTQSAGSVTIIVQRTGGAGGQITVNYSATSGTAFAGVDFTAVDGTLTFAPGEAAKSFVIPIIKNSNPGSERTINLSLSNPTSPAVLVSPYSATVTIYH